MSEDNRAVRNLAEPIRVQNVNLAGISAGPGQGGGSVKVIRQLAVTSDQSFFQKIIGGLSSTIEHLAATAGSPCKLDRANNVLLLIRPDNSGELWIDTAAMIQYAVVKQSSVVEFGMPIFDSDIADVTGIWYPAVDIGPADRILCIIREGWRFALYFDLRSEGNLSVAESQQHLGRLYRLMRYADRYALFADLPAFERLVTSGWFPFLELHDDEFKQLQASYDADFLFDHAEQTILQKFDGERVDNVLARWINNPHIAERHLILNEAIAAFKAGHPVSVIKIVLTEIEGILSDVMFAESNVRTHKIPKLLKFITERAEQRAGGKDTLFFPIEFGTYLQNYTYAGFGPGDVGKAGSRHAVGHGGVAGDQYTMTRALQAILTLDQLAFYI